MFLHYRLGKCFVLANLQVINELEMWTQLEINILTFIRLLLSAFSHTEYFPVLSLLNVLVLFQGKKEKRYYFFICFNFLVSLFIF